MNKKGAELSINTIIIAVLGLVVLAVLIYMVGSKLSDFRAGADTCVSEEWVATAAACDGKPSIKFNKPPVEANGNQYCCVDLVDQTEG